MKKTLSLVMAFALVLGAAAFLCAAKGTVVYVSIANGTLEVAREEIELTDADNDGALTIYDALYLVHEAKFEGGASTGFAVSKGDWGPYISKMWGVENGGSYSYYVNDEMAGGLYDALKDGDDLFAFVYTDAATYSDAFTFFDKKECADGDELTFYVVGFDENWTAVKTPTAGAEITVDGEKTGLKTDENGKVKVNVAENGTHIVSAALDGTLIVPPVCVLTKKNSAPETGDAGVIVLAVIALSSLAAYGAVKAKKG